MKRTLLLLPALLLLIPARAQKLEIGVSGGVNLTRKWDRHYRPLRSKAASLQLLFNADRHFQVGLVAQVNRMEAVHYYQAYSYTKNELVADSVWVNLFDPMLLLGAQMNYRQQLGCFEVYGGILAGYMFGVSPWLSSYENGHGRVLGGQLGGMVRLSRRFGISAEAAPRHLTFYRYELRIRNGLITCPVTLGLRFRMGALK